VAARSGRAGRLGDCSAVRSADSLGGGRSWSMADAGSSRPSGSWIRHLRSADDGPAPRRRRWPGSPQSSVRWQLGARAWNCKDASRRPGLRGAPCRSMSDGPRTECGSLIPGKALFAVTVLGGAVVDRRAAPARSVPRRGAGLPGRCRGELSVPRPPGLADRAARPRHGAAVILHVDPDDPVPPYEQIRSQATTMWSPVYWGRGRACRRSVSWPATWSGLPHGGPRLSGARARRGGRHPGAPRHRVLPREATAPPPDGRLDAAARAFAVRVRQMGVDTKAALDAARAALAHLADLPHPDPGSDPSPS
jgi:hypothetical protein